MTNTETINKMTDQIEKVIRGAVEYGAKAGQDQEYWLRVSKINGMIDMLCIVTGDTYIFTDAGLKKA